MFRTRKQLKDEIMQLKAKIATLHKAKVELMIDIDIYLARLSKMETKLTIYKENTDKLSRTIQDHYDTIVELEERIKELGGKTDNECNR